MKNLFFFLSLILASEAYTYVRMRADSGKELHWVTNNKNIPLFIKNNISSSGATAGVGASASLNIINTSITRWNENGSINLVPKVVSSLPEDSGIGTISFSQNPAIFGDGVLGVTQVNYNAVTGAINRADIYINDSIFNFSSITASPALSANGKAYLGDIVSHEIGHLLGLAHTEVPGATMLYSIFKDQYKVSSDEVIAMKDIYAAKNSEISGKVVGLREKPVFGAQVLLISQENGKVVTGKFTDEEGNFSFSHLDKNHSYFVFIQPMRMKEQLPHFYSTVITDYCGGRFVPSFFTKCGAREKGRAQAINLGKNNLQSIDLGKITIRCDAGFSSDYLFEKISSVPSPLPFYQYHKLSYGESILGRFTPQEVVQGKADRFYLDLRAQQFSTQDFLRLNILTESISSALNVKVEIKNMATNLVMTYETEKDAISLKRKLDHSIYIPLSSNKIENEFEVSLIPLPLSLQESNEIFSGATLLLNENQTYLLSSSIEQRVGGQYIQKDAVDSYPYEDNGACLEGNVSYVSTAARSIANDTLQNKSNESAISCATLGDINSGGGGPGLGSFFIGLLFGFSLFKRRKLLS